jgi:predicted DNA-binding transcriptional regulator YafY
LQGGAGAPSELAQRVRILAQGARRMHLPHFQSLGAALMQRTRVRLRYLNRERNTCSEREVSPQRLVHYRDNWYLDAWCHQRSALRTFSVDAIEALQPIADPCVEMPESELDDALATSYGIFAGKAVHEAGLRFLPPASRWVASECWHPEQMGHFDAEGRWRLRLPYSDMRELVMDILRWVPHVEVLWPQELADEVRRRLRQGLALMDGLDE